MKAIRTCDGSRDRGADRRTSTSRCGRWLGGDDECDGRTSRLCKCLEREVEDLDPLAIHEGMLTNLSEMEGVDVYEVAPMEDARATGARIRTHRWIDRPTGDVVRSKLVVR